jgi:lysozyme
MRRPLIGVAAALALVVMAQPALAAISGPDVASYQHPGNQSINWNAVKSSGRTFAFVKATEDTTYTNPYVAGDWGGILNAGMIRGAYHFARPAGSAAAQANYFISVTGNTRSPGSLPPVLDLEDTGGLSPANLVTWTHTFLNTVQALTGRVPIVYSYPYFWTSSMGNSTEFTSYPLWLAQYNGGTSPSFPLPGGWSSYTFWQYTSSGSVPGIPATVDLSNYCCDYPSLQALAFGATSGEAPPPPPAGGTDLYGSVLSGTASRKAELHALGQPGNYGAFSVHSSTAFGTAADASEWQFLVAPLNGDGQPDLFGLHLRNTASGRVEVHVASAASGYQVFSLHSATAMPSVPAGQYQFALASSGGDARANLYVIKLNNTGTNSVEVHVLSEASNFSTWTIHAGTAFGAVSDPSGWQFRVADRSGSGDLIGIAHKSTGSGRTEVHVAARSANYMRFSVHTATPIGYLSDSQVEYTLGDHDNDGVADLYLVSMNNTGSGNTEVHILSGSSNYSTWLDHAVTGLAPTSAGSWQFSTPLRTYT